MIIFPKDRITLCVAEKVLNQQIAHHDVVLCVCTCVCMHMCVCVNTVAGRYVKFKRKKGNFYLHILKSGWISSSFILFLFFNLPGTCFYNKCFKRTSEHLVDLIWYKGINCQFLRFHRLSIVIKTDITTLIIIPTYIFPFLVYPPCLQLADRNRLKETHVDRSQPYIQCFPWCSNEQHL